MGQKGSKIKITEQDRAVLQLKKSKDEIHKFTRRTDGLITTERVQLKQLIKENPKNYKNNANVRFILKRIHYQEHLLDQASDQLINLENMVSTLEFKLIEVQFFEGLKNGNKILTKLNKEFNNVDEVLDNAEEQISYQNEIDQVLSQRLVGSENYEDEIDKELEQMIEQSDLVANTNMPTTEGLPSLKGKKKKEESNMELEPALAA